MINKFDKGPWIVVPDDSYAADITSDDFTHDVAIFISGDFEDTEQRAKYIEAFAATLNTADALVQKDEMIQAMESVLAKIGEHLKVSPGDVPALLEAIEGREAALRELASLYDPDWMPGNGDGQVQGLAKIAHEAMYGTPKAGT